MLHTGQLTQEQIKEMNRVNIIRYLKLVKTTTKQEIAKKLGLSIPTVTTNMNQLILEGLVRESGVAHSTGGRKPVIMEFLPDARVAFGVDLSKDYVKIMLINLEAKCLYKEKIETKDASFEQMLDIIITRIHEIRMEQKISEQKILGVGLSLPGLIDDDRNILTNAPNIEVESYCFDLFEKNIKLPLHIENEANIAAFAEQILGNAKDKGNLVYVSVTDGIGTGIIVEKHIYKGNGKKAGEFGHIPISDKPLLCKCGRSGCWEIFASKKALLKYYHINLGLNQEEGKKHTLDSVFHAYKNKESAAVQAVTTYTKYLYKGLENILLALNPDYLVIGGDIGPYAVEIVELAKKMQLPNQFYGYETTQILPSSLADDGSLLGAALMPLEDIFNFRKNVI